MDYCRLRESSLPGLSLSLFKWDATRLPLRDRSVDVVVSDVPYGKRHGSKEDNRRLYPHLLEARTYPLLLVRLVRLAHTYTHNA
jgi:tRNA G10  N-methylase Trm11